MFKRPRTAHTVGITGQIARRLASTCALAALLAAVAVAPAQASSGEFDRTWGKDVDILGGTGFEICTVAASCQAGTIGGLGGELNQAGGAATDAAGNLYVTDSASHRIQKFDSSGN